MMSNDDVAATSVIATALSKLTLNAVTATAPHPQLVQIPPTVITATAVTLIDPAGHVIGDGEVRVYSPSDMYLNDTAYIQVEIEANPQNGSTYVPSVTASPVLQTPRATATPLALVDGGRQFIVVRQCMGVELTATHPDRFTLTPLIFNDIGAIEQPGTVYWWKWALTTNGDAATGNNTFSVTVHPSDCASKQPISVGAVNIPFSITVHGAQESSGLLLLVPLGLIVLVVVGITIWFVSRRARWGKNLIFISYRRADSNDVTGRLYDHLTQFFGPQAVFKDVYSIPPGVDFRDHLRSSLGECKVMLVIIGDQWASITDQNGQRRLSDPGDFVRIEVQTGLSLGLLVIPVLVKGATVPSENDLPAELKRLAFHNAILVRNDPDFPTDVDRLIKAILTFLQKPR
jgi:hypothetical protein